MVKNDITKKDVQKLIDQGYCVISNKFQAVSRIDRKCWINYMAFKHAPWNIIEGLDWATKGLKNRSADHYRRVYSKDRIEFGGSLHFSIFKLFPKSGDSDAPQSFI